MKRIDRIKKLEKHTNREPIFIITNETPPWYVELRGETLVSEPSEDIEVFKARIINTNNTGGGFYLLTDKQDLEA